MEENLTLKKGISLVLLCYEEEENLRVLIPQIREQLEGIGEPYEILIVDAPEELDRTREVCEAEGARYVNQEDPAFGGAFRTGIRYAAYDKFFIMDADGSHRPAYIPEIYRTFMEGRCDVAIGSRYVAGGVNDDAWSSRLMSHILNAVYGIVLGVKVKDMSTDFRMYRTKRLREVEPELRCRNYDVLQEVLLRLKLHKKREHKKFTVRETPITFDKRLFGHTKRKLIRYIISYIKSVFYLLYVRAAGVRNR